MMVDALNMLWICVRKYGGVLEHPAKSFAWREHTELLKPSAGKEWSTSLYDDGWVCEIDQGNYGHPARKRTWLYAVGCDLPKLTWGEFMHNSNPRTGKPGKRETGCPTCPKAKIAILPRTAFRQILIDMARSVKQQPNLQVING